MTQWHPITDPPGTAHRLVSDGHKVEKAYWHPRKRCWMFPHSKLRIIPTHWTILPQPPTNEKNQTLP